MEPLVVYLYRRKHPLTDEVYPEGEELLAIWERDETAESLALELPKEIERSEE